MATKNLLFLFIQSFTCSNPFNSSILINEDSSVEDDDPLEFIVNYQL